MSYVPVEHFHPKLMNAEYPLSIDQFLLKWGLGRGLMGHMVACGDLQLEAIDGRDRVTEQQEAEWLERCKAS